MAHFKRGRPHSSRGGCHMCKWYKDEQFKDTLAAQPMQERRALVAEAPERFPPGSKSGPRTWVVEYREKDYPEAGWFLWRKYRTEAGRDAALRAMSHRIPPYGKGYEYRAI